MSENDSATDIQQLKLEVATLKERILQLEAMLAMYRGGLHPAEYDEDGVPFRVDYDQPPTTPRE